MSDSNWSIESNWYVVSIMLVCIVFWLWRDLRDCESRKKRLGEIAQNLLPKKMVELTVCGRGDDGQGGTYPIFHHKGCDGGHSPTYGWEDMGADFHSANYCPGCGAKIKKT